MKKVLIFSLAYYPKFIGGDAIALKAITDRIDPSDIEFHMITLRLDSNLPTEEKVGNIFVHRIGFTRPNPSMADLKKFPLYYAKWPYFQIFAALAALALHKKYHFDATWAMMAHSAGVPAALFKLFKPKVPYLLTLQEGDPLEYIERKMKPFWPLFARAFTSADMIQVISTFLGAWARRRGYGGPLEVVPNAVDTKHFSQTCPEAVLVALKQKLGKKDGDIFLITTSRLVHKNGVDDVIRALRELSPSVHFIVLGIGPDEQDLKHLVDELDLGERVRFLGHIDHSDLPEYLKASDIFIRPSRSEGFGNSFVEAMAAGLPVIATQEGGIADFLFDAKQNPDQATTGWAVDKDSPEQIAEAVKDIIANPEKVKEVTKTAGAMVVEKYDWDVIAKDMQEEVFGVLFRAS